VELEFQICGPVVAVLPHRMQFVTVAEAELALYIPPPLAELFAANVQLVMVVLAFQLTTAPP
jgi:hypothetical protein